MTADYGLGIDLGTTHTAAAVLVDGRVESARLGARRMEIPSAIFVKEDGGLLVGDAAERRGQDEPARLAREFKRRLGDPVPTIVGGMPLSTLTLTAKLLRYVLDTVTTQQSAPPAHVALTYPAHWGPYKRDQLDQAIRLADAGPVRLISEPEAVAHRHAAAGRITPGETVAVYDLGGSSFDVAVLRRDPDGFTLLGAPEGVDQLGGGDFDEAVYAHVLSTLDGVDFDDPEAAAALARLRRDCVEAKESLSFDTEVTVPVALPGRHTRIRISRATFESLITLPIRDTVDATRRALRSAGIQPDSLAGILLAGGSSKIPLVASVLNDAFGRPIITDSHPELSVALGAASLSRTPIPRTPEAPPPDLPAGDDASEISRRESAVVVSNGGPPTRTAATEPAAAPVSPASLAAPGSAAGSATTVPAAQPGHGTTVPAAQPGHGTTVPAARGAAAGGSPAGGSPAGGSPSGGSPAGGSPSGGSPAGGSPAGGSPAGGSPSGGSPAARLGLSVRPAPKQDFTELRTPADPWAAVEAAEAEAARIAAAEAADAAALRAANAAALRAADAAALGAANAAAPRAADAASLGAADSGALRAADSGALRAADAAASRVAAGSSVSGHTVAEQLGTAETVPGYAVPVSPAAGTGEDHEPSTQFIAGAPFGTGGTPYGKKALTARRRRTVTIAGVVVVVVAAAATGIALSNLDGENKATGAAPSAAASAPAGPAPVPTQKLVIRTDTGGPMNSASWQTRIQTLDPVTGAREDLAGTEPGDTLPRWSNDRSRIALTHRSADEPFAIYVMDKTGENRRVLVEDVTGGRVVWSPDDSRLAFVRKVGDNPQIFTIPAGGGEPTALTDSATQKDDPVWSADGKSIIYWAKEKGVRSLFALDVANPQEPGRRITEAELGDSLDPAVSPDGTQILFTRKIGEDNYDVWQIGLDGSGPKPVTNDAAREMDPTWSVDGEWFAYVRGDLNHPQIYIERKDGTGEQPLTKGDDREGHPCWF
ncbi:hypothetical protein ACTI_65420 [Actinoplanes sp. OR16]|uniref:Hsp70 family protein n=1 Tax=Actinoplanes sp. OR16 TaxID=946334 RepID=UPI000F70AE27|nr:Hsp70 family protein [Actinoplanes sp. OR16]BBH69857.1 hypothetical protein ACTI_65420 [Actinoplanes sp. OR16]